MKAFQGASNVLLILSSPSLLPSSRQEDVSLHQLEQECLQFFESTIDSLEKSFEEGEEQIQPETPRLANSVFDQPAAAAAAAATFPSVTPVLSSSPAHSSPLQTRTSSTRVHDIIDLVRPEPDLVPHYNATAPGITNHKPSQQP